MNNPVSGESSARGQGPHIAVGPAAVAIRRPELWNAWNGARHGTAWLGSARLGLARNLAGRGMAGRGLAVLGPAGQGTWAGVTTSKHKTHTEHGNNTTQH